MIIDSNIFLEVILEQERVESASEFLNEILKGEKQGFISTFSIDSIILNLVKNNAKKNKIISFLNGLLKYEGLRFYQIKIKDRIDALNLMSKHKLDYEDAVILQSAISTSSDEIVSFDKHFDNIKEIKRIEP